MEPPPAAFDATIAPRHGQAAAKPAASERKQREDRMDRQVFITGGSGFIGRAIVDALAARGERPRVLSRNRARAASEIGDAAEVVEGDPSAEGAWQDAVRGCRAVINLAGSPMHAKRWNDTYRQVLRDSRIETTRHVVEAIGAAPEGERPTVLANASGIDYYPFEDDLPEPTAPDGEQAGNSVVTEESPAGDSFLAKLCLDWEAAALRAQAHGTRVVLLRTGVVLGPGGALAKMKLPFKLFVGGRIGRGDQWFSWIHIDDVVAAYLRALDDAELSGPINVVAPEPVRNRDFTRALARALRRPAWFPVPEPAIKAALGELGEYITHGRRAVPRALEARGFSFSHPDVDSALRDAV
jgi:uncharacterized protein